MCVCVFVVTCVGCVCVCVRVRAQASHVGVALLQGPGEACYLPTRVQGHVRYSHSLRKYPICLYMRYAVSDRSLRNHPISLRLYKIMPGTHASYPRTKLSFWTMSGPHTVSGPCLALTPCILRSSQAKSRTAHLSTMRPHLGQAASSDVSHPQPSAQLFMQEEVSIPFNT